MRRAAIYARVSSSKQRDAHTIESQLHELRPFIAMRDLTTAHTFIDDGRSAKTGKLDKRDGFAQLLRAVADGEIDVLVTAAMDRLTRTEDFLELAAILGPFQRAGIPILSPKLGEIDLRTPAGMLQAFVMASSAATENASKSEAVKRGKARSIANGRKPGGPTPFGWTYARDTGAWALHPTNAEIVREIFRRVIAGESCLAISDHLHQRGVAAPGRGRWTRHRVWIIANKRRAIGELTVDKRKRKTIAIPPIIDEDKWEAAQAKLAKHGKRGLIKTKHVYLLDGLATCAACGSRISIRSATFVPRRGYMNPAAYVCNSRKLAGRDNIRCTAPIVRVAEIDELVWERVAAALNSRDLAQRMQRLIDQRDANRKAWRADAATYRAKLDKLTERKAGIMARYQRGLLDDRDLDTALANFRREQLALEAQVKAAEDGAARDGVTQVDVKRWLGELRTLARSASPSERQRIVRSLVRPGSAAMKDGVVTLTMLVEAGEPFAKDSADVLAVTSGCRSDHEEDGGALSIRVVAEGAVIVPYVLDGQRFGQLTVLELAARATHGKSRLWRCRCDCGAITSVPTRDLRSGNTTSCGCVQRDMRRGFGTRTARR